MIQGKLIKRLNLSLTAIIRFITGKRQPKFVNPGEILCSLCRTTATHRHRCTSSVVNRNPADFVSAEKQTRRPVLFKLTAKAHDGTSAVFLYYFCVIYYSRLKEQFNEIILFDDAEIFLISGVI